MTTQTIGIREFRQNMTALRKKAQKHNICYIVMNHQTPLWRMQPIDEDQLILEKYASEIEESIAQVNRGETYTLDEVVEHLRLQTKKK